MSNNLKQEAQLLLRELIVLSNSFYLKCAFDDISDLTHYFCCLCYVLYCRPILRPLSGVQYSRYRLYRATGSAVFCLVVPAFICIDLLIAMCFEIKMMMMMMMMIIPATCSQTCSRLANFSQ